MDQLQRAILLASLENLAGDLDKALEETRKALEAAEVTSEPFTTDEMMQTLVSHTLAAMTRRLGLLRSYAHQLKETVTSCRCE